LPVAAARPVRQDRSLWQGAGLLALRGAGAARPEPPSRPPSVAVRPLLQLQALERPAAPAIRKRRAQLDPPGAATGRNARPRRRLAAVPRAPYSGGRWTN